MKKEVKKCVAVLNFLKDYEKMLEKKQSSIDWLVSEMINKGFFNKNIPLTFTNLDHLQHKAKEIEKQNIINAYNAVSMKTAEEYYKENFEIN